MGRESLLILAAVALICGAPSARADDDRPKRGTTFTTDSDVSLYRGRPDTGSTVIHVLRGTEAKASEKDPGVVLQSKPKAAEAPPPTRKGRRGRRSNAAPEE